MDPKKKNCVCKKFWVLKDFGSNKIVGLKKNFGSERVLGPKKFWILKKMWAQQNFWSKNFQFDLSDLTWPGISWLDLPQPDLTCPNSIWLDQIWLDLPWLDRIWGHFRGLWVQTFLKIYNGHIWTIWMLIIQKKLNFKMGSKRYYQTGSNPTKAPLNLRNPLGAWNSWKSWTKLSMTTFFLKLLNFHKKWPIGEEKGMFSLILFSENVFVNF